MNKQRRGIISKCIEELEDIKSRLEDVQNEEESAYDNLPDSLMYSEKGDTMQENIDNLSNVIGYIEDSISDLNDIVER